VNDYISTHSYDEFLDPEGGSQKATVVVVVLVVISSPLGTKIPKQSAVKLSTHILADYAHSSTVSDFL